MVIDRRPLLPVEIKLRQLLLAVIGFQICAPKFRPHSVVAVLAACQFVTKAGRILDLVFVELPPDLRPRLAPFVDSGKKALKEMGSCPNPGMVLDEYLDSLRDGLMLVQQELSLRTSDQVVYAA
jgi:hypothetical protein